MKLKNHRSTRQEQFPAAARVFDVADHNFFLSALISPDRRVGDKAVGPVYKSSLYDMFVSHDRMVSFLCRLFIAYHIAEQK